MEDLLKQERDKKYNDYVKTVTPTHNLLKNCVHAFLSGGVICLFAQLLLNFFINMGIEKETAGLYNILILMLISVIFTGFGLFARIVKWAGAGILVPITGFANGVASPAIEFKREGQVFGIGCKIFTIAGPVILYGLLSSWVLGFIYWIAKMLA